MDELLIQLKTNLRAMWRHRHLSMVVMWIAGVIAAVGVIVMPDKYEATARIYVDTQSILQPLMQGMAVRPNVEQQVQMLSRTLLSRPNLEKLVRMADLDLKAQSKAAQDELIDSLGTALQIRGTARDNLYSISYRDTSPDKAKRVVQALTSIFVESSLGDKRKDSDSAKKFIDDQIRSYEKKLEEAETRLKEFKLRNVDLMTAEGKTGAERMGDVTNQLNMAKLALREAENARDALKKQLAGEEGPASKVAAPVSGDGAVSLTPELDNRINGMRRNLDALLQRFTDQHPDVLGARRVLKELEEQRKQEVATLTAAAAAAAAAAGTPVALPTTNPVAQKLRMSLGDSEATVAGLKARVAEYEARFARAKETMKLAPQLEAEYSQLNRDYEINKKNYEGLVTRRESATITGDLGAAAGVADFRLIDPPRVSPQPVAPNRLLLLPGGFLLALGCGVAASFVATQVRPVFHDGRSIREVTGLPLLGTVHLNLSEPRRRAERRSLIRFGLALAVLMALYGVGLAYIYMRARGAVS